MWQGVTDSNGDFTFNQLSTISIAADPDEKLGIGTEAYTKSNCIGLLYDWRALGICPYREKVTSNYTASADFTNTYHHRLINWIIDANYSMVAFFLD